jgi:hypothetical protein
MTSTYYKWRVYCTTEGADKNWVLKDSEGTPTTCPTNSAHSIDASKTAVINTVADNVVTVREEYISTGGNFQVTTLQMVAAANTTTSASLSFPYPISALSIEFVSREEHRGDTVNGSVGKDTIIGYITAPVVPALGWTGSTGPTGAPHNYVVGEKVTYSHPVFGTRVYTCIANTVNSAIPTNTLYWKHGYEVSVSSTVTQNTATGFFIKLDNFSYNDNVKRILSVNKTDNKIYVETNPTNSYSPASPTYVRQTVYTIYNYIIGEPWEHDIGNSKIGGAYIPADTLITLEYTNGSTGLDKELSGKIQYLY